LRAVRGTAVETGDPAVVLLDIKMPRMNGLDVLTQMRGDERCGASRW
jgi:CheY-like chemotaxis protein